MNDGKSASLMEKYVTPFTSDPASWVNKCIISVDQFSPESIMKLFHVSNEMKLLVESEAGGDDRLKGKLLATLFYENSTRTCCSFQAAMLRLGGRIISVNEATSSVKKGESLEDTVSCLCSYCDVIAMRHPLEGAALQALQVARKPLVNAGDGIGEHPTQALLDLYTIHTELGSIDSKIITIIGDLKHGRTVHSLARLLALYDCEVHFVSPPSLRMPEHILEKMKKCGCLKVFEEDSFEEIVSKSDVLYLTRVQRERFENESDYEFLKQSYCITPEVMNRAKSKMILMHPLPRVCEISPECDSDPRAAYIKQMENGMIVRMALLSLILGKSD